MPLTDTSNGDIDALESVVGVHGMSDSFVDRNARPEGEDGVVHSDAAVMWTTTGLVVAYKM